MIIQYPDYYNRFHCIADRCPDTCCRGWDVDVDKDSASFYSILPGPFGERLRGSLQSTEEGYCFPLTKEGNCPFLDRQGLCDIYKNVGEDALCLTCREFPRYFAGCAEYEQRDLSLSCPEAARIFFEEDGDVPPRYIREEADEDYEEYEEEALTEEEKKALVKVLEERDARILALYEGRGGAPAKDPFPEGDRKEDLRLLECLEKMESIGEAWQKELSALRVRIPQQGNGAGEEAFLGAFRDRLRGPFRRLSAYYIFRYSIDAWFEGTDGENERRLRKRSLRTIFLLCMLRYEKTGTLTREDLADIVHLFSRETEHSEENLRILREP